MIKIDRLAPRIEDFKVGALLHSVLNRSVFYDDDLRHYTGHDMNFGIVLSILDKGKDQLLRLLVLTSTGIVGWILLVIEPIRFAIQEVNWR